MKRYVVSNWQRSRHINNNQKILTNEFNILDQPIMEQLPDTIPVEDDEQNQDQTFPRSPEQPGLEDTGPVDNEPNNYSPELDSTFETGEDDEPLIDFETEKMDYLDLALKRKHEEMLDKLLEMRDIDNLKPGQYKFIEDNIQILSLSRDVEISEVQKKIYKDILDQFRHLAPEPQEDNPEIDTELNNEKEEEQHREIENDQFSSPEEENNGELPSTIPVEEEPQELSHYDPLKEQDEEDFNIDQSSKNNLGEISGTELYSIISEKIEQSSTIVELLLKLPSFYSMKSDLFRKTIAALTNGVQIGSGGTLEDIFIPIEENGVGIKICTRCYTSFSNIQIGKWAIQYNDPENFLSDSELEKLNNSGSPEEKEVLRKRVIIESISNHFKDRVFVILIVNPNNGRRHELGFNFAELLRDGWKNGYLSVHFRPSIGRGEAGVQVDGELIDLQEIQIDYLKTNSDELDEDGKPTVENIELMKVHNGYLYLTILEEHFYNFSNDAQQGLFYSMKEFDQDQEQLITIQRCIPDIKEILLRKC